MKERKIKMKRMKTISFLVILLFCTVEIVFACECPIKVKDHVSSMGNHVFMEDKKIGKYRNFYWHCGDVKSVSNKYNGQYQL